MTYEELLDNLEQGVNLSFSRFGDGEFNCMYGKRGGNCDHHFYFRDLGKALRDVWDDPKGIVAMQSLGYGIWKERIGEGDWPDADILHHASAEEGLKRFWEALSDRDVIIVGPHHIKSLRCDMFIQVPKRNCWLEHDNIKKEIERVILPGDVVLYSCSMMAGVLIHEMYAEDITQIDTGSVFDPYCGVKSRGYHHHMNID